MQKYADIKLQRKNATKTAKPFESKKKKNPTKQTANQQQKNFQILLPTTFWD